MKPVFTIEVPPIDWPRVRQHVADFNSSGAPYYLAEVALHEAFARDLTAETIPLCIMAVNSFWNANVDKEPGALKDMCERAVADLDEIKKQAKFINTLSLPTESAGVAMIVSRASQLLPRFLKSPYAKRTNYSFASKFLHWCCPSSLPIVDNLSVKTINYLVGRNTIWVPNANNTTTETRCLQSYEMVIRFYNQALSQLDGGQMKELVDFDFKTQPDGFHKRNTPVRILDKWLWMDEKQPLP